jgi:hypothetical protein
MRALSYACQLKHEEVLRLNSFVTHHSSTRSHPPRLTPRMFSATDKAIQYVERTRVVETAQFNILQRKVVSVFQCIYVR